MKYIIFIFLSATIVVYSQPEKIADTLSQKTADVETQSYKIDEELTYLYKKPKFFEFVTKLPRDFSNMGKDFVRTPNLIFFSASLLATAALIPFDQQLTDQSIYSANKIFGWNGVHTYFAIGSFNTIPKSVPTALYFFGNGATYIIIGGSILIYGVVKNDYRSYHVSSQLLEGILATGVITQTIKRVTGRESPFIARGNGNDGGAWRPLPSFAEYQSNTPKYDAMPSGHLATAITSILILGENYPKQKWIKPVGFTLSGLMCFEMMRSEVHWASDYPLAIFIGYMIGKNIPKNRIEKVTTKKLSLENKYKLDYTLSSSYNCNLAGVRITF